MVKQFQLSWLCHEMGKEGTRPPITAEELEIVNDLDRKVFEELKRLIDRESANRDPAYLAWAARRHWFWHYYQFPMPAPEARPLPGGPVVPWYDEEKPWIMPGLESFKRERYPMGWDRYVNSGIQPVRSSKSVPKTAESEELLALKRKLKAAEEAKAIRETAARLQALELEVEEAKRAEMALKQKRQELARKRAEAASMEAQKADIQGAAKRSGQQGFGNTSPKSNKGLDSSKWNKEVKQANAVGSVVDDFPSLETKGAATTNPPWAPQGPVAQSESSEAAIRRQINAFGWKSEIRKRAVGSRQGMGRGKDDFIVVTLWKRWLPHFKGHKDIATQILRATKCELITVFDHTNRHGEISIGQHGTQPFSAVLKAHDMMLVYCEQQAGRGTRGNDTVLEDKECYNCGQKGHIRSECPDGPECWNCGEIGHDKRKCPKPPVHRCWTCRKVGHHSKDCKQEQPSDTRSKAPVSKGEVSDVSKGSEYLKNFRQGDIKRQEKERNDVFQEIQCALIDLGDKAPINSLMEMRNLSLTVLQKCLRGLRRRQTERDGAGRLETVFHETHKTRKGMEVSKDTDKSDDAEPSEVLVMIKTDDTGPSEVPPEVKNDNADVTEEKGKAVHVEGKEPPVAPQTVEEAFQTPHGGMSVGDTEEEELDKVDIPRRESPPPPSLSRSSSSSTAAVAGGEVKVGSLKHSWASDRSSSDEADVKKGRAKSISDEADARKEKGKAKSD